MTQKNDLTELFKQASEIASVVPEAMQAEAFNRALELLQGASPKQKQPYDASAPTPSDSSHNNNKGQDEKPADSTDWIDGFSSSSHPEVFEATKVLNKALIVLKIARDDYGVPSLSAATISTVLKEKFREKADVSAVRMALTRALSLVDRSKDANGGFIYKLMRPGELYLQGDESQLRKSNGKKVTSTKAKAEPATKKQTSTTEESSKKTKKRSTSRPGPKAMVEQLIEDGFFAQGKIIGDVIGHASQNMGHTYKVNDLAPAFVRLVRQQKLSRKQNQDGQYEYTAK